MLAAEVNVIWQKHPFICPSPFRFSTLLSAISALPFVSGPLSNPFSSYPTQFAFGVDARFGTENLTVVSSRTCPSCQSPKQHS